MHWVIQKNLYKEHNFYKLLESINYFNIPHTLVNIRNNEIFDENNSTMPLSFSINEEVMVCGGYLLTKLSQENGWTPGVYQNENFNFKAWCQGWGKDQMLNELAVVDKISSILNNPLPMRFFARPMEDNKAFTGRTFSLNDFTDFIKSAKEGAVFNLDTEVLVAPLKRIYKEARFFVVNGEIVTQSLYKLGAQAYFDERVDDDIKQFAMEKIVQWQPARAFVLDIAACEDGLKIIEVNTINSAGFYDCDVSKLVFALNNINEKNIFKFKI